MAGAQSPPSRRCSSSRAGWTTLPGFILSSGSKMSFSSPNAPTRSLAEHPDQQLTAGLAVAVLAGQRPAIGDHQVGGPLHEPPVRRDALGGVQVERDPGVHAALAEVAVQARHQVARRNRIPHTACSGRAGSRQAARALRRSLPSPRRCRAGRAGARWRRGRPRWPATARPPSRARPGTSRRVVLGVVQRVQQLLAGRVHLVLACPPPNWTIRIRRARGSSARPGS